MSEEKDEKGIDVPVWWKNGGMLIRRDALPDDHEQCTYNYIKNVMGLKPENYGVYTAKQRMIRDELSGMSRQALINEVAELRMQLLALERAGF